MFTKLAARIGFSKEDIAYLASCSKQMTATAELCEKLDQATDLFLNAGGRAYEQPLHAIAEATKIHRYTVDLAFLLLAAPVMQKNYLAMGIDDEIYYNTLQDLLAKLAECKRVYGIVGTFVTWWYPDFYTCKRFALGRLQYERIAFPFDDYKGILNKGDTVYNCHIPSLGPLTEESVTDSLRRAHAFYKEELKNAILPVYCSSWLLHPPTADAYPKGSNMRAFYEAFDILAKKDDERNPDFWRVFDCNFSPENLETAPTRTSLQKNIKAMLQGGQPMGHGKGILLFDGEKILDKNDACLYNKFVENSMTKRR